MSKIANCVDCNTLIGYDYFKDVNKCPTYEDIQNSYSLSVKNSTSYINNQLVQLTDIEKIYKLDMPLSIRNTTSIHINPRIDIFDGSVQIISLTVGVLGPGEYNEQKHKFNVKPAYDYTWYLSLGSYNNKTTMNGGGINIVPSKYDYYDNDNGTIIFFGGTTYIQMQVSLK